MKKHLFAFGQFDLSVDWLPFPIVPYVDGPPENRTMLIITSAASSKFELNIPLSEENLDKLIWELRKAKAGRSEGGSAAYAR